MPYSREEPVSELKYKVVLFMRNLTFLVGVPAVIAFLSYLLFDLSKDEMREICLFIFGLLLLGWIFHKDGGGGGGGFIPPSAMG